MFYLGIVEDNSQKQGLKVRIFHKHTFDKSILPTEDLPFSKLLTSESNIDGISYFRSIENGTTVVCGFLDKDEQYPIVFGSIEKNLDELPNFNIGFSDINQNYPTTTYLNELMNSRLARNEKISQTIVQTKINERETNITCNEQTFSEPENQYNTTYPNNRVLQTRKHIIEIDDTDGSERVHIYHNSGTFNEINPDGSNIEKIKGEKFLSVENDLNIIVHGNANIKSNGDINLNADNINLNGTSDNLVSWDDLNTIYTSLVGLFNEHVHPGVTTGPSSTGQTISQIVAPNLNLNSAKVDTIKIP